MTKSPKQTTSKSTIKRSADKRLSTKKLATVTGGWGCSVGSGV